jgi:hypothetical protein
MTEVTSFWIRAGRASVSPSDYRKSFQTLTGKPVNDLSLFLLNLSYRMAATIHAVVDRLTPVFQPVLRIDGLSYQAVA